MMMRTAPGARLIGFAVFVGAVERFELLAEVLDIRFRLPFADAHAVADEELEKIMEELHHLAGEMLELFFSDVFFPAGKVAQLALNKVINELSAVHLATVFVDLLDDVFLDHHDQIVFIQQ